MINLLIEGICLNKKEKENVNKMKPTNEIVFQSA